MTATSLTAPHHGPLQVMQPGRGTLVIASPRGEAGDDRVHGAIPFPDEIHGRGVAQPLVFEAAHEREDLTGQGVRMVGQPGELAGEGTQHVLVAGLEVLAGGMPRVQGFGPQHGIQPHELGLPRVADDDLVQGIDRIRQGRRPGLLPGPRPFAERVAVPLVAGLQQRDEKVFLAADVVQQPGDRQPAAVGELLHAEAVVAALPDDPGRLADDLLPPLSPRHPRGPLPRRRRTEQPGQNATSTRTAPRSWACAPAWNTMVVPAGGSSDLVRGFQLASGSTEHVTVTSIAWPAGINAAANPAKAISPARSPSVRWP